MKLEIDKKSYVISYRTKINIKYMGQSPRMSKNIEGYNKIREGCQVVSLIDYTIWDPWEDQPIQISTCNTIKSMYGVWYNSYFKVHTCMYWTNTMRSWD